MSNKAIAITVLILLAATGYLLAVSDEPIDMGGEKHGEQAPVAVEPEKAAPAAAAAGSTQAARTERRRTARARARADRAAR